MPIEDGKSEYRTQSTDGPLSDKQTPAYKKCSTCGKVRPIDKFSRDKYRKDGRRHECKDCYNAAQRARDAATRAKFDEIVRKVKNG